MQGICQFRTLVGRNVATAFGQQGHIHFPDHFRLQRLQGKLFVLASGIQIKGKWDAVFDLSLKIIVGTVIVKDFRIAGMNKVGVLVKFFLNVIRFFCENGKGTVKILQGIFRRFQQGMTVGEAAELAGRGKDPCINQIRKNSMEVISKLVMVTDIFTDVVQTQFSAELLQE